MPTQKQAEIEVAKTRNYRHGETRLSQLAYLQQTLAILRQNEDVLDQLIQKRNRPLRGGTRNATRRTQAQVEQTKLSCGEIRYIINPDGAGTGISKVCSIVTRHPADIVTKDLLEALKQRIPRASCNGSPKQSLRFKSMRGSIRKQGRASDFGEARGSRTLRDEAICTRTPTENTATITCLPSMSAFPRKEACQCRDR